MKKLVAALIILSFSLGCLISEFRRVTMEAVETGDAGLCKSISDPRQITECMLTVAAQYQNLSVCQQIESMHWREECITNISIQKDDMRLCDIIERESGRDYCYKRYGSSR
jgi:hypothetical protein